MKKLFLLITLININNFKTNYLKPKIINFLNILILLDDNIYRMQSRYQITFVLTKVYRKKNIKLFDFLFNINGSLFLANI